MLVPSTLNTACPYKGVASYFSVAVPGAKVVDDIAWSYPDPLHDAVPVGGLIAFLTERLDLTVDGEARARPRTPWS